MVDRKDMDEIKRIMLLKKTILDGMECENCNVKVNYWIGNDLKVDYTPCCDEFGDLIEKELDRLSN